MTAPSRLPVDESSLYMVDVVPDDRAPVAVADDSEDAADEAVARLSETIAEYLGDDRVAHHLAVAIVDDYFVVERTFSRERYTS